MHATVTGHPRHRGGVGLVAALLAVTSVLGAPVAQPAGHDVRAATAAFADPAFREDAVFTGLTKPIAIRFAADGRVFVAEKAGIVKVFDSLTDTSATTVIDLRAEINSYWDRGLLGLALDPAFTTGRPYLYLFYVYDAPLGQTAPVWNDVCPTPPGGVTDGCVVSSRLVRFTVGANGIADPGSRVDLIRDWCQQFPSHSGGGIDFGPDGWLYVTGGDGGSFNTSDYGQLGGTLPNPQSPVTPVNPCHDPVTLLAPNSDGSPNVDLASSQGGSLRAQDVRTTSDPTGLDGSLIRVDPDTGAAVATNPLHASSDANTRRIVAYGFRNPFRFTFRPGTNEIYVGDVGNQTWEEINRFSIPTSPSTAKNLGWPCYEGPGKSSWQSLGVNLCTSLYSSGSVTAPLYSYSHTTTLSPVGPCFTPDGNGRMGAAVSGLAFYGGASAGSAAYPAKYAGALFFVDYSRSCIAVLPAGTGGVPDATKMQVFETGAAHPVDLVTGPGGDLFYVDLDGGRIMRIRYRVAPVARASATPDEALAPVSVTLDGSASTDPDPSATLVAYRWDLDHDGVFTGPNDRSGKTVTWDIATPAIYPVTLEVESSNGLKDTAELTVDATDDPPLPSIQTPSAGATWRVGDHITFSGSASDPQDGSLAPAALSWDLWMLHCPADCHQHLVQSWDGVSGGSFDAPDHEYPSHLELRLTAIDSHGSSRTTSVALEPLTTTISLASQPTGVPISVNTVARTSPSTTTVLLGGQTSVSAPLSPAIGGKRYRFASWNDGAARSRLVTATGPTSLTASFVPDAPDTCASATTTSANGSWLSQRLSGNGDVDWYRFSIGASRRVIITLGDLPLDARLDLYSSCSTRLASSDHGGTRFEEITRGLAAGTYRVRVSSVSGAASTSPWLLRFRPLTTTLALKSTKVTVASGTVRIIGEAINNMGSTRGRITVTADLKDGSGRTVATLSSTTFARRIPNGGVSSFMLKGSAPAFATISYHLSSAASPASVPSLSLVALHTATGTAGTVLETGTVKNVGSSSASSVSVARVWYGRRGEVLGRGTATVSPSTLAAGASGTFSITRPALLGVQATQTQLRGS